jgi:hypothetical protein
MSMVDYFYKSLKSPALMLSLSSSGQPDCLLDFTVGVSVALLTAVDRHGWAHLKRLPLSWQDVGKYVSSWEEFGEGRSAGQKGPVRRIGGDV